MDENKICEDREPKYNYCIIKYEELYLKEFSLYSRVNCENNEVTFEADTYLHQSIIKQINLKYQMQII